MGGADDVVVDERQRIGDAAIDVRRGGQMENVPHRPDRRGDLAVDRRFQIVPDEMKSLFVVGRAVEDFGQPVQIARRIEPIEADDVPIGVLEQMLDQMVADEAGSAGDQDSGHVLYSLRRRDIISSLRMFRCGKSAAAAGRRCGNRAARRRAAPARWIRALRDKPCAC